MILNVSLPNLPSAYSVKDPVVDVLSYCLTIDKLLNKPFKINIINEAIQLLKISKKDEVYVFQNLLRSGILYSFADTNLKYVNPDIYYYFNAEKVIQALITRAPNSVIGKKLFKFEIDAELYDGGFIRNQNDIFSSSLIKLEDRLSITNDKQAYLPGFVRIYECIGTADGRDFFTQTENFHLDSITKRSKRLQSDEAYFAIPKYRVLQKQKNNGEWIADNNRLCVCIS